MSENEQEFLVETRCRSSVVAHDTDILFFGGLKDGFEFCGDVYKFCTHTCRITPLPIGIGSRPLPRVYHAAVALPNNSLLIHGGVGDDGYLLNDVWVLEPNPEDGNFLWKKVILKPGTMASPALCCHAAVVHPHKRGSLLFVCGKTQSEPTKLVYELDLVAKQWRKHNTFCKYASTQGPPLLNASATVVGKEIFVYGGETPNDPYNTTVYALDIDVFMWRSIVCSKQLSDRIHQEGLQCVLDTKRQELWLVGKSFYSCCIHSAANKSIWIKRGKNKLEGTTTESHEVVMSPTSATSPSTAPTTPHNKKTSYPPPHHHSNTLVIDSILWNFVGDSRYPTTATTTDAAAAAGPTNTTTSSQHNKQITTQQQQQGLPPCVLDCGVTGSGGFGGHSHKVYYLQFDNLIGSLLQQGSTGGVVGWSCVDFKKALSPDFTLNIFPKQSQHQLSQQSPNNNSDKNEESSRSLHRNCSTVENEGGGGGGATEATTTTTTTTTTAAAAGEGRGLPVAAALTDRAVPHPQEDDPNAAVSTILPIISQKSKKPKVKKGWKQSGKVPIPITGLGFNFDTSEKLGRLQALQDSIKGPLLHHQSQQQPPLKSTVTGLAKLAKEPSWSSSSIGIVLKSDPCTMFRDKIRLALKEDKEDNNKGIIHPDITNYIQVEASKDLQDDSEECKFNLNSLDFPPGSNIDAKVHLDTKDVHSVVNLKFVEMNRHLHLNLELHITLNEERHNLAEAQREMERQAERERDKQRAMERQLEREREKQRQAERAQERHNAQVRDQERIVEAEKEDQRNKERQEEQQRKEEEARRMKEWKEQQQAEQQRERQRQQERQHETDLQSQWEDERTEYQHNQAVWIRDKTDFERRIEELTLKVESLEKDLLESKKHSINEKKDMEKESIRLKQRMKKMDESFALERKRMQTELEDMIKAMENPVKVDLRTVGDTVKFIQSSAKPLTLFPSAIVEMKGNNVRGLMKVELTDGCKDGDVIMLGGRVKITDGQVLMGDLVLGELVDDVVYDEEDEEVSRGTCLKIKLSQDNTLTAEHLETLVRSCQYFSTSSDAIAIGDRHLSLVFSVDVEKSDGRIEAAQETVMVTVHVSPAILLIPTADLLATYRTEDDPYLQLFPNITAKHPIEFSKELTSSDYDQPTFQGALLTVSFARGFSPGDSLILLDEYGATVQDKAVLINNKVIGRIVGGDFGEASSAVVQLEENSDVINLQSLIRSFAYKNPTPGKYKHIRQFEVTLLEDSIVSPQQGRSTQEVEVSLIAGDEPTTMALKRTNLVYRSTLSSSIPVEMLPHAKQQYVWLGGDAIVEDPDTDSFNGGDFVIKIDNHKAGDELHIVCTSKKPATPAGGGGGSTPTLPPPSPSTTNNTNNDIPSPQIQLDGTSVMYGTKCIGVVEERDDTMLHSITVFFDDHGKATVDSVQELLRSVAFISTAPSPVEGTRNISINIRVGLEQDALKGKLTLLVTPPLILTTLPNQFSEFNEGGPPCKLGPHDIEMGKAVDTDKSHGFLGGFIWAQIVKGFEKEDSLEFVFRPSEGFATKQEDDKIASQDMIDSEIRTSFADIIKTAQQKSAATNLYRCIDGKVGTDLMARLYSLTTGTFLQFARQRAGGSKGPITADDVELILKHLHYATPSNNIKQINKIISIMVDDGRYGYSQTFCQLQIAPVNDATEVVLQSKDLNYRQGSRTAARGFTIFKNCSLEDPDTDNFNGGYLTVDLIGGGDFGDQLGLLSKENHLLRVERTRKAEDTAPVMAAMKIKRLAIMKRKDTEKKAQEIGLADRESFIKLREREKAELEALNPTKSTDSMAAVLGSKLEHHDRAPSPTAHSEGDPADTSFSFNSTTTTADAPTKTKPFAKDVVDDKFVSVDKNVIMVDGEIMGRITITGAKSKNTPGSSLRVDFDNPEGNVALESVAIMLRAITYQNVSPKVKPGKRIYQLKLSAGDSAPESSVKLAISVLPPLMWTPGFCVDLEYREGSGEMYISPKMVVNLQEGEFIRRGFVTIKFVQGNTDDDYLGFEKSKRGEKYNFVVEDNKLYNGVVGPKHLLASIQKSRQTLAINFVKDGVITKQHLQQLLRSLWFRNDSNNPGTHDRILDISLSDGNSFDQSTQDVTIHVAEEDDATEIELPTTNVLFVTGSGPTLIMAEAKVTDPDTEIFESGAAHLSVSMTSPNPFDQLSISSHLGIAINDQQELHIGERKLGRIAQKDGELGTSNFKILLEDTHIDDLAKIVKSLTFQNVAQKERQPKKGCTMILKNGSSPLTRVNLQIDVLAPLLDISNCPDPAKYKDKELDLIPAPKVKSPTPSGFSEGLFTVAFVDYTGCETSEEDQLYLKLRFGLTAKKNEVFIQNSKIGVIQEPDKKSCISVKFAKKVKDEWIAKLVKCVAYTNTNNEKKDLVCQIELRDVQQNCSTGAVRIVGVGTADEGASTPTAARARSKRKPK